jgi:hypothetical protein
MKKKVAIVTVVSVVAIVADAKKKAITVTVCYH